MFFQKAGDMIQVRTPYEDRERVKKLMRGARWDSVSRSYVAPATIATLANLMEIAGQQNVNPMAMEPETRSWYTESVLKFKRLSDLQKGKGDIPVFPENFKFLYEPRVHQRQAIAFAINQPRAALWLDLGLGKTFCAIHIARYRHEIQGTVSRVLVLLPLSIMDQWASEITKYGNGATSVVIDGTAAKKRRLLSRLEERPRTPGTSEGLEFVLVTYESAPTLLNELTECGFDMAVLDESTKVKNPKAKRTEAAVDICSKIPYCVELTGLAYLNHPTDLFGQFMVLDKTVFGGHVWSFEERYVDFMSLPFGRVPRGIKNLEELKARSYFLAFSRDKKDCLDLPDKIYMERKVDLNQEQLEYYDKVAEDILTEEAAEAAEDIGVTVFNTLSRLEKLQQITAGFVKLDDGSYKWLGSAKYQEAIDTVQSSTSKYIIWYHHTLVGEKILEMLKAADIRAAALNSTVKGETRRKIRESFKSPSGLTVLVCSLDSEHKGLDLTSQEEVNAIYLQNTFSIDFRWQSESRNHRMGMTGSASYLDIVCRHTIDEQVLGLLSQKYKVSEYISKFGLKLLIGDVKRKKLKTKREKGTSGDDGVGEEESLHSVEIEGLED